MTNTRESKIKPNSWQHTQNSEYLKLIRHRIEHVDLTWVTQFLDIIKIELKTDKRITIKDIGCQCFQFYKQIKKNELPFDYYGYELDENYVQIGLEYFPELTKNIYIGDFTSYELTKTTDVSLCSATIEHVDNWSDFLEKMLSSSNKMVIIRTFLGENTERVSVRTTDAKEDYPIWQFGFKDFLNAIDKLGWTPEIKRDIFTDSLPVYKSYGVDKTGVVRTQYVIVAKKSV
jgi:hypothetical protein